MQAEFYLKNRQEMAKQYLEGVGQLMGVHARNSVLLGDLKVPPLPFSISLRLLLV